MTKGTSAYHKTKTNLSNANLDRTFNATPGPEDSPTASPGPGDSPAPRLRYPFKRERAEPGWHRCDYRALRQSGVGLGVGQG